MGWDSSESASRKSIGETAARLGVGFVDAVKGGDRTCSSGCADAFNSLCKNGVCVTPSCEDARPHCQSDTTAGLYARMLCPVTCGCKDPYSPLVLCGTNFGCGSSCRDQPEYKRILKDLPCEDAAPGSVRIRSYAEQFFEVSQVTLGYSQTQANEWKDVIMRGCTDLGFTPGLSETWTLGGMDGMMPFSWLCPVTYYYDQQPDPGPSLELPQACRPRHVHAQTPWMCALSFAHACVQIPSLCHCYW